MITNVLFAFGVACLVVGRIFERPAFVQAGVLLSAAALFRIVYFDLFLKNPLWYPAEVAGVPPFDALTVAYAVPILWAWLAAGEILRRPVSPRVMRLARYLRGATLVLASPGSAWKSASSIRGRS